MRVPADGWDEDERDALADLRPERGDESLGVQARRLDDAAIALLRAAPHDVLPSELQAAAERRLQDPATRAVVTGLDEVDPEFDGVQEALLLARIKKEAAASRPQSTWTWRPLAFGGAVAAAVVAALWLGRPITSDRTVASAPTPQAASVDARPNPAYEIPFDKPDVTLSLKALTWRGGGSDNRLLADLKPGLDAFRGGDYTAADRAFASLEQKYSDAVEVFFYGGASRLLLNEPARAIAAFDRAAAVADETFAPRVAWYRAVAHQRAGNAAEATRQLQAICSAGGEKSRDACAAVTAMAGSRAPNAR